MAAVREMMLFLLFLFPLCSCEFPRRKWEGMLKAPPTPKGVELPSAQWFQQKLNHFDSTDTRTWIQRYFVNDEYWDRSDGPVFLMLGGEAEASPTWLETNSEIMINAAKYKALVVLIEHRYYGGSRPTPNLSTENLKYLSSRQALEDVVTFHKFFSKQFNLTSNNKWVSFGGSYSGALSAWLRIKHPEIVVGAVASSGPVQAVVNFSQYLEVVNNSLATSTAGDLCDECISKASGLLNDLIVGKQWKKLDSLFHVNPPLQSSLDVQLLTEYLIGYFMTVVQYNGEGFEVITLDGLCSIMTNSTNPILDRFVAINNIWRRTIYANFQGTIDLLKEVDWDLSGERQWMYQKCTEFGFFKTTDSVKQPFGHFLPLDYYMKWCELIFKISSDSVTASVAATNAYYGGKDIPKNVTNIVFPNGSIDPWHALSVTKSISESLIAIFIKGTAHCANMYPPRDSDPPELTAARKTITQQIGLWLNK